MVSQDVFLSGSGGQDKASANARLQSSVEPYSAPSPADASPKKHHGSETRRKVHMSTRVPAHVRLSYVEIANTRGGDWTPSSVLAEAAEEWLVKNLAEGFGQQIATQTAHAATDAIRQEMRPIRSMLSKDLKATEEIKHIAEGSTVEQAKELAIEDVKG